MWHTNGSYGRGFLHTLHHMPQLPRTWYLSFATDIGIGDGGDEVAMLSLVSSTKTREEIHRVLDTAR
jgi:hypothetical protein